MAGVRGHEGEGLVRAVLAPAEKADRGFVRGVAGELEAAYPPQGNDASLKEGGNVLLLDEPTNDIDVNTLRALEEGLENFAGCAVVISHDRWFLDRVATHILSFEGDSQVVFFEGGYSEYEEHKRLLGEDTTPKRVKYRKLME